MKSKNILFFSLILTMPPMILAGYTAAPKNVQKPPPINAKVRPINMADFMLRYFLKNVLSPTFLYILTFYFCFQSSSHNFH